MERRLRTPGPAFVISRIALFVALGGTTHAATSLPKNSVGTNQLKKNAVTSPKIKTGAVNGHQDQYERSHGSERAARTTTVQPVSITAPAAGFVLLQADYNSLGTGCPCEGWYLLKDDVNNGTNANFKITRIETSGVCSEGSLGWVFP